MFLLYLTYMYELWSCDLLITKLLYVSLSNLINGWMDDHLQAGKRSRYVTSHPCQVSQARLQ